MRLVGVSTVVRDLREARPPAKRGHRAIEPDHPSQRLRCQPDLLAEPGDQLAMAPPELRSNSRDRRAALRRMEVAPRPRDSRVRLPRVCKATEEEGVDEIEALRPVGRLAEASL